MNKIQLKAMQDKCTAFNKIVKVLGQNHKIKLDSEFDANTSIEVEKLNAIQRIIDSVKS